MEERGFITRLIKFITIRIFVLLGEIAQFNTCLVILVPNIGRAGNDSNLLIVFYVQIMPDDFVMQLHRF